MQIIQTFETTVTDSDSSLSAHFIIVPERSLTKLSDDMRPSAVVEHLKLDVIRKLGLTEVMEMLTLCLEYPNFKDFGENCKIFYSEEGGKLIQSLRTKESFRFAEQVFFTRTVPFESSPLSLKSLAEIASTSGVALGAVTGYLVVSGNSPMLFVWVPLGMLLFGATAGIARALEAGLRERISKLFTKSTKPHRKTEHPEEEHLR
jgi:hypothetical protein